jgi:uncharacterized protein (TIGR02996 family)
MAELSPPDSAAPRPEIRVFLQEIKSNPDDDTPRLVLADWLQEHGDPLEAARGEMLRIQVLLHQLHSSDPRQAALRRRQNELFREYLDLWVGPLADCATWRFERGFLHLEARAPGFLHHHGVDPRAAGEICDWVEALKLEDVRPQHLPRLARSPFLPCIHTLDLSDNRLPGEGFDVLVSSPTISGLKTLFLDGNRLGSAGVQALAASPNLAGLTTLDLTANRMGDEGARFLADSPYLTSLTTLWVRGNTLGGEALAALRKRFGKGVRRHERRRPATE